jgi:hypothetical protein
MSGTLWWKEGVYGWRQSGGYGSFKFRVSSNAVITAEYLTIVKNGEVDLGVLIDISTMEVSMIPRN